MASGGSSQLSRATLLPPTTTALEMQNISLGNMNDGDPLTSWSDVMAYTRPHDVDHGLEHYEPMTLPETEVVPDAGISVPAVNSGDDAVLFASNLHENTLNPFRPMVYQSTRDTSVAPARNIEDFDHFLLREMTHSRRVDDVAQSISRQFGFQMSVDQVLLAYRAVYWKAKTWQDRDTQVMEQTVRAELASFWERIASKMRGQGCPEWPPNEVKMRCLQLHPEISCLYM